jgi:SAM-dependent methyltransferase
MFTASAWHPRLHPAFQISDEMQYVAYDVCASTRDALYTGTAQSHDALGHTPAVSQPHCSHQFCAIANELLKVPVTEGLLEDFHPGRCYDAIVLWDVLEHLYEPIRVTRHASRLLRPGGIVLIQVPNYRGLGHRFKVQLGRWRIQADPFKHFGFPWHVYSFDRRSLTALLAKAGMTPIRFESWPGS